MDFGILGPLEARDGGRAVALGGSKQRALLALLLLHANETLTADRVIDELWGERPPVTAGKALQVHVSNLRKALAGGKGDGAEGVVLTRDRGYELRLDPERLDARRFERLLTEGRGELAGGHPDRAATVLEEALGIWRGPPLTDVADEAFAQPEIGRLEELRVDAEELLGETKLALGRHAEVVERLGRLVVEYPYREGLRAQLMLALYRCDRQADALQAYQDARRELVDELGIEPGERLRGLEAAILTQDPSLRQAAARPAPPGAARGPLVGRLAELAELTAGLDDALAAHGRLLLVAGEPGIGKSRISDELMIQAEGRGARILVGRSWEAGGAPAYWPWIQALRACVRGSERDAIRAWMGHSGADLATILPELRELFPDLPRTPDAEGGGARFRLYESVASFIRGAAASQPLAIFLDDLHAADASSVLLLRFVAEDLAGARLLVVGCYRDTEVSAALAEALPDLARAASVRRVALKGLSEVETERLLEQTAGEPPPADLAARIYAETDGNPLFAGEVARMLAAEGRLDGAEGSLPVPQGVSEAVGRRLASMSETCRHVLALASVIGREFDPGTLQRVGGLGEGELFAALEEAMPAGLVAELPEGGGRLRFSHMLIRDSVYEALPPTRRPGLHARIAAALEDEYGGNLEPHSAELAHQFVLAGPAHAAKALEYAVAAGDRAASQLAHEEAGRHFQTALRVLEKNGSGDHRRVCELLLRIGEALSRAGDAPQAKETLRRAAAIAEREGWPELLSRAALNYGGRFGWERASTDPSLVPLLNRALAAVGDGDSIARVRLLARLAAAMRDDATREARVAIGEEALAMAERIGDPGTLASAIEGYWAAVEEPSRSREGLRVSERLMSLGGAIGDPELVFHGHDHRLHLFMQLGDRVGADVEFEALSALAAEMRQPAQRWHVATERTAAALLEGRFEEAERLAEKTLAIGRVPVSWNAWVSYKVQQFVLSRQQGRLAELEQSVMRWVHEYPVLFRFRCALAHLYGDLGREREARAALDDVLSHDLAREYVDAEWLFCMVLLADPCRSLGDADAAARLHGLLSPYAHMYASAPVEATFGSAARALGVLATVMGRFDDAERHFRAAVDIERAMRARPWVAHAQHDFASMLVARGDAGDAERAAELMAAARATYRELGMDAWAARASVKLA